MDETMLQSVEQDASAWLGTEEDGGGNDISLKGGMTRRWWRPESVFLHPNQDCVSINLLTSNMRL